MSEDLVPVNISCSQDHTGMRFHITAYNSQVEKILDVTLSQPGIRIGQASECFVYWKDDKKNDTWGLNFTSPIDAKQFRECCVSFFSWNHHDITTYIFLTNVFSRNFVVIILFFRILASHLHVTFIKMVSDWAPNPRRPLRLNKSLSVHV